MKRDVRMPQGKYRVGRDIPEGIYLIASLNDYSHVKIEKEDPKAVNEYYHLDDENSKICHVEIVKGDVMYIDGNVKIRHITKFMLEESTDFSLFEEIEDFKNSTLGSKSVKKNDDLNEEDPDDEADEDLEEYDESQDYTPKKAKMGFWSALGTLFDSSSSSNSSSSNSSSFWSTSSKKKDAGRCDGDCANCPAHYGYRYGRWYYGHGHQHGCERGGNGGASGKCHRD